MGMSMRMESLKPVADTHNTNGVFIYKHKYVCVNSDGVGQNVCCWLWSFQMC